MEPIVLTNDDYLNFLHNIRNQRLLKKEFLLETNMKQFVVNLNDNLYTLSLQESNYKPIPSIFDELSKYTTSVISGTSKVNNVYSLFYNQLNKELLSLKNPKKEYIYYAKGSLVYRNKVMELMKFIKNKEIKTIFDNIICLNSKFCNNPLLNESDFDVNFIVFSDKQEMRQKYKNIIANVLIKIKNEMDNEHYYKKWINKINNNIYNSILDTLKENNKNSNKNTNENANEINKIISKTISNKLSLDKTKLKTKKNTSKHKFKITQKKLKKKFFSESSSFSEFDDKVNDKILKNNRINFVNYDRMIELLKDLDQTRYSFYINNLKNYNYTFQTEINNFHNIDNKLMDLELIPSQLFITINENINSVLENNDSKKIVHFDLYRLKLNFAFHMKYNNKSNEFIKKIGGELIDVSFPYPDNAYMTNRETYRSKLMNSHTFEGLYEFNGFGLLSDLVEMIELESIDTNKPYKLEKRINRFIFLRFLEYWFRIPFKIVKNNNNFNEKIFKAYNSLIRKKGNTFNMFFKQTIFFDTEFSKINKALETNQGIDIYKIYRKFLRNEPYQTLFKIPRDELDKALGFRESDFSSFKKLISNNKPLYSIFYDTKNAF